jgi:dihydroorotase
VELIRAGRARGIDVTAETCPHYLLLDGADFDRLGAVMKVMPPIREREDQEALWAAVGDGVVASIGSDHAPHTEQQKHDRLDRVPGGIVAAQTLVPLMLDAALDGRLPLTTLVSRLCTSTASMFGLYPRKGVLEPGSDADLVIVDPVARSTIEPASFESKQHWSPFAGRAVRGRVEATMLRGRWLLRDGTIVGSPRGRWVRRGAQASGTAS